MSEGVYIDGVGKVTLGLNLLGNFLGVGRGKYAGEASVLEGVRQAIQKLGDGVRKTNGCQNARAEERIAAESVEQRVFGPGDIGVDPLDVG